LFFSLFSALEDNPVANEDDLDQFYIVFVSSIRQADADAISPIINNKLRPGKVTFVALKNANQNILKNLVPDVIDWSKIATQDMPTDWEAEFWKAYGCSKCFFIIIGHALFLCEYQSLIQVTLFSRSHSNHSSSGHSSNQTARKTFNSNNNGRSNPTTQTSDSRTVLALQTPNHYWL
jgi:hypothetical protein